MPPIITLSPSPPTRGEECTITMTGGTPPVTFEVDCDPDPDFEIESDADGKATFTVPDTATSLIVSGGGATPVSTVVL